jgi:hypothetical protein
MALSLPRRTAGVSRLVKHPPASSRRPFALSAKGNQKVEKNVEKG